MIKIEVSLLESCAEEGATRLKDGITSRDGRLEICFDGYWGSVCNRGWTQNNGLVACRQVGYETLRKTKLYLGLVCMLTVTSISSMTNTLYDMLLSENTMITINFIFMHAGPLLTSSPTRMNGSVSVHNAQCNGHESQLEDCEYSEAIGVSSCHHGEDVALICSGMYMYYMIVYNNSIN